MESVFECTLAAIVLVVGYQLFDGCQAHEHLMTLGEFGLEVPITGAVEIIEETHAAVVLIESASENGNQLSERGIIGMDSLQVVIIVKFGRRHQWEMVSRVIIECDHMHHEQPNANDTSMAAHYQGAEQHRDHVA